MDLIHPLSPGQVSAFDIAAVKVLHWRRDPVAFVRDNFGVEPDWWQREALEYAALPGAKRLSMQACVGPGKSAVLAWIIWWFLVCFGEGVEHPKGAAVSITRDNLRDNLWTELAKWREASPLLLAEFEWKGERVYCKRHPKTWWVSARAWPQTASAEQQASTLSGLHSQYVLAVIDEAGEIPLAVKKAAEQALSNCTWGLIAIAGNPTSSDGILHAASTDERDDWHVIEINGDPDNPRRASRVDLEWAAKNIARYGRDDPWVISHILGRFPPQAFNALLTLEEVKEAKARHPRYSDYAGQAKIIGVDVAREGLDRSVLFPRQGLVAFQPTIARGLDGPQGAGLCARLWSAWKADALFIDGGGGYATSWVDFLRVWGYEPVAVKGAERASTKNFVNRRAEMLWNLREWVRRGGALPNEPELDDELTKQFYTWRGDALLFEDKDQVKVRIGRSPDLVDALGFTFAHPVLPPPRPDAPAYMMAGGGHVQRAAVEPEPSEW